MMKRISVVIGLLLLSAFFTAVCWSCVATTDGGITAYLGQEFTLPVGKMASIEGESLTIKFIEVISDSRCPEGVECVWAGEAQCRLHFTIAGSPAEMVIVQPGGGAGAKDYFIQYKIEFRLEPYPQEGQQIDPSDYKLIMTITK